MNPHPYKTETHIRDERSGPRLDLGEIGRYRDLFGMFVWRELSARYRQTLIGPFWIVLQPLLMSAVYSAVFGLFARIPTGGSPKMLFYFAALLPWNYFAQGMGAAGNSLAVNAHVLKKVYFPRIFLPMSPVVAGLAALAAQGAVFAVIFAFHPASGGPGFAASAAHVIAATAVAATLALGTGLWIGVLTIRYRDLQFALGVVTQVWMLATPVIYPLSAVPERWRWLVELNPMTGVVESYRYALLGAGDPAALAGSAAWAVVVLAGGFMVFSRTERTLADLL